MGCLNKRMIMFRSHDISCGCISRSSLSLLTYCVRGSDQEFFCLFRLVSMRRVSLKKLHRLGMILAALKKRHPNDALMTNLARYALKAEYLWIQPQPSASPCTPYSCQLNWALVSCIFLRMCCFPKNLWQLQLESLVVLTTRSNMSALHISSMYIYLNVAALVLEDFRILVAIHLNHAFDIRP